MTRWIVLLDSGRGARCAYGPMDDPDMAEQFAAFLSRQVDPAAVLKLLDPVDEVLGFINRQPQLPDARPIGWPPEAGDIWQDKAGDRWACVRAPHPYLTCLARPADDNAEEIWRVYGPMTRVEFVAPNVEEPPF